MVGNFTQQTIKRQLAQRSGQIGITRQEGGYQFVDQLTNRAVGGPPVDSSLLATPQNVNDPRITAKSLALAKGFYEGKNVPEELVEAIATVASYVSVTRGIPVSSLIQENRLSDELVRAYNAFKPKGSQMGYFTVDTGPTWINNPTLRGSIRAALVDE